ncbi:hypothetical protein LTR10_009960 [Elasticomyces elasticus]|nr:hypothetical protein LTR10_009960 [Elasticomyces elasticus]KAK4970252.1 hypothetical protein LTR42_008419 [Elasticomyces elasticus]
MATDTYWQLEKDFYTISADHDFVVRIIEHETVTRTQGDGDTAQIITESVPSKVHEFRVKRDVLSENSNYFANMLSDAKFKEGEESMIELHESNALAITVWLKITHDVVDDTTYQLSLDDVWYMLAAAQKYGFSTRSPAAKLWFEKWYDTDPNFDFKEHQMMLLPLHSFDHASGFRVASKYIVYRATGNIFDRRPAAFEHGTLGLDPNIINQLNGTKARLKTVLHRDLYKPIEGLLRFAKCQCKAEVLFAYEHMLTRHNVWPLETAFVNQSVDGVLRKLELVPSGMRQPRTCGTRLCSFDFGYTIAGVRAEMKKLFDGLCLDCMATSNPASPEESDEPFWAKARNKYNSSWDKDCRIRHQQPTWFFSFIGERSKMNSWVEGSRVYNQNQNQNQNRAPGHVQRHAGTAAAPAAVQRGEGGGGEE